MQNGKSAGALVWAIMMALAGSASAQTVGVDRIYAAEARAAALEAQNQQLRNSVDTQANAIRRIEQELDLVRKNAELEQQNLREAKLAADQRILQLQQLQGEELMRSSKLESELSTAKAELARLEALLVQSNETNTAQAAQLDYLRSALAEQQTVAADMPRLQQQLKDADQNQEQLQTELANLQNQLAESRLAAQDAESMQVENQQMRLQIEQLQQQLNASRDGMRDMQEGLNELATVKAQLSQSQSAQASSEARLQEAMTELVELRRTVGTELEPTRLDNERLQAQIDFLTERNNSLQEIAAAAPSSEELARRDMQNQQLQSELTQANAQLAELRERQQALQNELATAQSSIATNNRMTAEHQRLMNDHEACESQLLRDQAARDKAELPTSLPEDIRRISELEAALDRANNELRSKNQAFQNELQVERAMAAGTQAELESSYQARITDLQSRLANCR